MDLKKNQFLIIRANGFETFCDALISSENEDGENTLQLISLFGNAFAIEATGALIIQGALIDLYSQTGEFLFGVTKSNRTRIITTKIVKCYHKIFYSMDFEGGTSEKVIVFGKNIEMVKKRAFLIADKITTVPLKKGWSKWLWDNFFFPVKLNSFGCKDMKEVWELTIPIHNPQFIEDTIIEAVKEKAIN